MTQKKIVLHLITGLGTGGAERMLTRLVSESNDTKIQHVVVSMIDRGFLGQEIEAAGVELYVLNIWNKLFVLNGLWRLHKIIKKVKPDVIQTWLYHADLIGAIYTKLFRFKGMLLWNIRCSNMDYQRYKLLTKILAKLSNIPDIIIANSKTGLYYHKVLGYNPREWRILPNGVNIDRFKPDDTARRRLEEEFGFNNTDFIVGVVARNDPVKAHSFFLAAFKILHEKAPNLKAILIGSGTKKLSQQKGVVATGARTDIEALVPGLDVLCLPSLAEGFPNVVVEAMACGVPCVVTDVGDAREIVGDTGVSIAPEFVSDIVYALEDVSNLDQKTIKKMGKAARQRVVENWSLSKIIQSYNQLYIEC